MPRIPLQPETRAIRTLSLAVTALMVALAIAALAAAAALRHVDLDWRDALANRWTVELTGEEPGNPDTDSAAHDGDGARVVSMLRRIPGILDAQIVAPDKVRQLLQPWLGDTEAIRELPLPILIDIRLDPANPPQFSVVAGMLGKQAPGATLDDHGRWIGDLTQLAGAGEMLGLAMFAIIVIAATLTVATAARARLAINRPEIELLHRIGASDLYIMRQFQIDALRSSIVGAILGVMLAAGAGAVLVRQGMAVAPLLPRMRLEPLDWAALAAVPIGAVLISAFMAQLTAWALVRRLP